MSDEDGQKEFERILETDADAHAALEGFIAFCQAEIDRINMIYNGICLLHGEDVAETIRVYEYEELQRRIDRRWS